jgi:O-antigen/teichoic acid export membrane protein
MVMPLVRPSSRTEAVAERSTGESALRRILANSAGPAASFVAGPILARALGVEGRGLLAAIAAPLTLALNVLSDVGGEVLAARLASRRRAEAREVYWPGLVLSILIAIVLASAVFLLAPVLLGDSEQAVALLRILAWSLIPTGVVVTLRAVRRAERRYNVVNREPLVGSVGRLVALVVLYLTDTLTLTTAAVVTAISMFASILVMGRPPRIGTGKGFSAALAELRSQASQSGRVLLGNIANLLTARVDQLLLTPLAGAHQLGLYVVAVALAELPIVASEAVRHILLTETALRKDPHLVARACRIVLAGLIPVAAVGALVARPILGLLFGEDFEAAAATTAILLVGTVVGVPGGLLATGLMALGRTGLYSIPMFLGLAVTGIAAPIAINSWGAVGAATASVIAYFATSGAALVLFRRATGISIRECLMVRPSDLRAMIAALHDLLGRTRSRERP